MLYIWIISQKRLMAKRIKHPPLVAYPTQFKPKTLPSSTHPPNHTSPWGSNVPHNILILLHLHGILSHQLHPPRPPRWLNMIQPPHLLLLMNLLKIIHKEFGGLLSKSQKIETIKLGVFGKHLGCGHFFFP